MMLELNEVLLEGEPQTLSLMAMEGCVTCLTGGTPMRLTRWLHVLMGLDEVKAGFVCIDGEPFMERSVQALRRYMAYAPARLEPVGQVHVWNPPTVQDVFSLRENRNLSISNGILGEEMRHIAADTSDPRVRLLAVAALLNRPILLVDNPPASAARYLCEKAGKGMTVVVASCDDAILQVAKEVVTI